MKHLILLTCSLCAILAVPVPSQDKDLEFLRIPLNENKELDVISLAEGENEQIERNKRTIGVLRELFPELTKASLTESESSMDLAAINERLESINRVVRNTAAQQTIEEGGKNIDKQEQQQQQSQTNVNSIIGDSYQNVQTAATEQKEAKAPAIDELTLEDEDSEDNRNKRFLSFGASSGHSGGSGGGSGNFLFDIIRLVSGGSGTEHSDEQENAPVEGVKSFEGGDHYGYTEGIPGPVTRLFVLANRGIANLIQDLILRIAATSERLVNFKARVVTALI